MYFEPRWRYLWVVLPNTSERITITGIMFNEEMTMHGKLFSLSTKRCGKTLHMPIIYFDVHIVGTMEMLLRHVVHLVGVKMVVYIVIWIPYQNFTQLNFAIQLPPPHFYKRPRGLEMYIVCPTFCYDQSHLRL